MTLDAYLAQKPMTEAAFAERIGTHQTTVHRMRNGKNLSPALIRRVVEETRGAVTANDLLGITA